MSEPQEHRPPVLDYHSPADSKLRSTSHLGRCWPGGIAAALLLVAAIGAVGVHQLFGFALLASFPFACLQIVLGITRVRDSNGQRHWRVLRVPLLLGFLMASLAAGSLIVLPMVFHAALERMYRAE